MGNDAEEAPRRQSRSLRPTRRCVQKPPKLEVCKLAFVPQGPENWARPSADSSQPTDQLDPGARKRVEVEGRPFGGPGELHGRDAPCPDDVVNFVVAFIEDARRVHPPMNVSTSVVTRSPHVLAYREGDLAAGTLDL